MESRGGKKGKIQSSIVVEDDKKRHLVTFAFQPVHCFRSSECWLSLITLFLILIYEGSRAPFELWNIHHFFSSPNGLLTFEPFIPGLSGEPYKLVMKWAVYAPCLLHPFIYFLFSPEARHGVYILFSRLGKLTRPR